MHLPDAAKVRAMPQALLASDAVLDGVRLQPGHAERAPALEKREWYSPRHVAGRQAGRWMLADRYEQRPGEHAATVTARGSGSWMAFPQILRRP